MKELRDSAFLSYGVHGILCAASLLLSTVNQIPVPQTAEPAAVEKHYSSPRRVPSRESGTTTVEVSPDSDLGRFLNSNSEKRPKLTDPRAHGR